MKICFLTHNLNPKNGYGRYASDLINGIKNSGVDVVVLKEVEDGYRGQVVLKRGLGLFFSVQKVKELANDCDIIHALDGYPYGIIAALANKKLRKKLILTAQGTYAIAPLYNWPLSLLMRWAYKAADHIIGISRFTLSEIIKNTGLSQDNTTVINHGIDFKKFYKSRINTGTDYIIGVGAVKERKGYHISIEAFAKIAPLYPKLKYYIIGDNKNEYYLDIFDRISGLNLRDRIIFLSDIDDMKLADYYAGAQFFILTPINTDEHHVEGFGLVYLEAASAGLPVIGTLGNGAEDAINKSINGLLVPQKDIEATAEAMRRILDDDVLKFKMSQASYQWAEQHKISYVISEYLKLYYGKLHTDD